MTLAEQAARRIDLARKMGAEPRHWIATGEVETELVAQAAGAWSEDGQLLHGIPVRRGQPRSEWGLDLISGPGIGHA